MTGPRLVLGTPAICNFLSGFGQGRSSWDQVWSRDPRASRLTNEVRKSEWLLWKQAASSFAGVVLALASQEASDVWSASPSSQRYNLIKHFGTASPVPPAALLRRSVLASQNAASSAGGNTENERGSCTSRVWHNVSSVPQPHQPYFLCSHLTHSSTPGRRFYRVGADRFHSIIYHCG